MAKIKLTDREKESLNYRLEDTKKWMVEEKQARPSKVKKKVKDLEERIMKDVASVDLFVGDFYEDCRYHPMVCVSIDRIDGELIGISLINGKLDRCDYYHCGIAKLTPKQAVYWRLRGPEFTKEKLEEMKEADIANTPEGETSPLSYWEKDKETPELTEWETKLSVELLKEKDWKRISK
jgi:hypothetical protein